MAQPDSAPQPSDASPTGQPQSLRGGPTLMDTPLRRFFEAAVNYGASDLLVRGEQAPRIRLRGRLQALKAEPVSDEVFEQWIEAGLSPIQRKTLVNEGAVDLSVTASAGKRFRINIFRTRGQLAIAARLLQSEDLTFARLHLPPVLEAICRYEQGLVLVSGVTGSGKSTTLAAMLEAINHQRACHIVTLEDPIEYLLVDDKAMIHQREVGPDLPSFEIGLRSLLRENPDVVMIGEMRDKATMEAALQAAETGHLVLGSIHAPSTSGMFARIYELFAPEYRPAIRTMLATQMRAFVCQRLLPTVKENPQRVPAVEVLLQSPPTRQTILDGREHELDQVIKAQRQAGMQSMADSLVDLVQKEFIHPRTAEAAAPSVEELRMRMRGIVS
ncbi:MAG: PilT/PilU family type 4a pilus ATPase [Phycisphaeraceae bacterium]|nr:PilT/PilU family type 4a pilus ATPase [Phycisphaeraceae bacterium]